MKKNLIRTIVVACLIAGIASITAHTKIWHPKGMAYPDHVVFNPEFLGETTGGLKVDRIEFYKDSTLVCFTANFHSHSLIKVDRNLTLEVDDKVLIPTGIRGLKFGEQYQLQRWGKHPFVLVYPPVSTKAKSVNIVELGGRWNIYGLRIDGGSYNRPTMDEWLAKNSEYYPGEPRQFIYPEPQTVVYEGIIAGYAPAFKSTFTINNYNEITGVAEPVEVPINEDGSFKVELQTYFPKFVRAAFPLDMTVKSYLEPGLSLGIYFDRNMILGQRAGNINVWNNAIPNAKALGMINDQLYASWAVWTQEINLPLASAKNLSEAKKIIDRLDKEQVEKLKKYSADFMVFPYTERVLLANEKAGKIVMLLRAENKFLENSREKFATMPPKGYYDFLKEDMNDNLILSSTYFPELVKLLNTSRFTRVIGVTDLYAYTDMNPSGQKTAIAAIIKEQGDALCKYLDVKHTPLWWQIMSAMNLASNGLMDADKISSEDAKWVIDELKKNHVITERAVLHALYKHYDIKQ